MVDSDDGARECDHPHARHMHGTRAAYVADRCRCEDCRRANRDAARARYRAIAYGRWQPYVDAGPVRAHVARLQSAGVPLDEIARRAGVGGGTVRHLMYGTTGSNRMRRRTAERLLDLNVDGDGTDPPGRPCIADGPARSFQER